MVQQQLDEVVCHHHEDLHSQVMAFLELAVPLDMTL
jgi:hypothetical protein